MDNITNNGIHNVVVRINGVLPDTSVLGTAEKSDRAAEIKQQVVDMNEPSYDNSSTIRVNVSKGKKTIFNDDIIIDKIDAIKFRKYIKENF